MFSEMIAAEFLAPILTWRNGGHGRRRFAYPCLRPPEKRVGIPNKRRLEMSGFVQSGLQCRRAVHIENDEPTRLRERFDGTGEIENPRIDPRGSEPRYLAAVKGQLLFSGPFLLGQNKTDQQNALQKSSSCFSMFDWE
jgi:hypothetical protein